MEPGSVPAAAPAAAGKEAEGDAVEGAGPPPFVLPPSRFCCCCCELAMAGQFWEKGLGRRWGEGGTDAARGGACGCVCGRGATPRARSMACA